MKPTLTTTLLMFIFLSASAQKTAKAQQDTSYNKADLEFLNQQKALSRRYPNCPHKPSPPYTLIWSPLAKERMKEYKKKITDCNLPFAPYVKYTINGALALVN